MHRIRKTGTEPGTLQHIGEVRNTDITIDVIDYNASEFHETTIKDFGEMHEANLRKTVKWINVNGVSDEQVIRQIGEEFGIHPLVLEDVMNTDQRPKVDFFDNYVYVVIKTLNYNSKKDNFESEQISLICGRDYVITFQEEIGDDFDPIRQRLRKGGHTRELGADFLAYTLIDLIVDTYYTILDRMGDWIEDLEDEILRKPEVKKTLEIKDLRRDLQFLRKNIWPVRELINSILRHEENIFCKETFVYFKDVYDHIVQIIDTMDTYRDMITTLMDLYLSNISFKMNEVMKMLTIIATIFIPITFITSLYGMNFENMPELHTRYGYFVVLAVIVITTFAMLIYFRRKKWL
jgi:magnesium transporter